MSGSRMRTFPGVPSLSVLTAISFQVLQLVSASNPTTCRNTEPAEEYMGTVSVTASGLACSPWAQTQYSSFNFSDGSATSASNYCRNPIGSGSVQPFCIPTENNATQDQYYCNIPFCEPPDVTSTSCCSTVACTNYVGNVSVSANGNPCQAWSSQTPIVHFIGIVDSEFQDGGAVAASNYCRNPGPPGVGTQGSVWCLVPAKANDAVQFEYCDVPLCFSTSSTSTTPTSTITTSVTTSATSTRTTTKTSTITTTTATTTRTSTITTTAITTRTSTITTAATTTRTSTITSAATTSATTTKTSTITSTANTTKTSTITTSAPTTTAANTKTTSATSSSSSSVLTTSHLSTSSAAAPTTTGTVSTASSVSTLSTTSRTSVSITTTGTPPAPSSGSSGSTSASITTAETTRPSSKVLPPVTPQVPPSEPSPSAGPPGVPTPSKAPEVSAPAAAPPGAPPPPQAAPGPPNNPSASPGPSPPDLTRDYVILGSVAGLGSLAALIASFTALCAVCISA